MSNRKTTFFYALLIAIASLAVGMVLASRLGLSPESSAQSVTTTRGNSAPITGSINATTFRDVAKMVTPAVVNIRTESRQRTQDLTDFFGGGGGGQGGEAAHEEEDEAEGEAPTLVLEDVPRVAPRPPIRGARSGREAEHGCRYLNPDLTGGVACP